MEAEERGVGLLPLLLLPSSPPLLLLLLLEPACLMFTRSLLISRDAVVRSLCS